MSGSLADVIQQAIYAGAAAGAQASGRPHQVYRPTDALAPIGPDSLVATLPAAFSADLRYGFKSAHEYTKPTWSCVIDGNQTKPGDILVGANATWFLASMEPLLPIVAVRCDAIVTISRPTSSRGIGALPPGGDVVAQEVAIMSGWPASVLQGTKGEKDDSGLPDDTRAPWVAIMMPAMPGVDVLTDDVISDDQGRRFTISGCERTYMGYRLTAAYAGA